MENFVVENHRWMANPQTMKNNRLRRKSNKREKFRRKSIKLTSQPWRIIRLFSLCFSSFWLRKFSTVASAILFRYGKRFLVCLFLNDSTLNEKLRILKLKGIFWMMNSQNIHIFNKKTWKKYSPAHNILNFFCNGIKFLSIFCWIVKNF